MTVPSLDSSSGSAFAQKPLCETRSGQAYLGKVSGLILDGSLHVKPRRRAPLQQHCFLVIWRTFYAVLIKKMNKCCYHLGRRSFLSVTIFKYINLIVTDCSDYN